MARLGIAWTWEAAVDSAALDEQPQLARATNFETTPLMVDGTLYATTPLGVAVALDPASGRLRWRHDPGGWSHRPPNLGWVHRGLAYRPAGRPAAGGAGVDDPAPRLYLGTLDGHLVALDAITGEPVDGFGAGGRVDLTAGLRRPVDRRQLAVTSPPALCSDVVVVGASISEGAALGVAPPGDVRAFDAITGAPRWSFHTVAQPGEPGHETWLEDSAEANGHANVWAPITVDPVLGVAYLPTSTPTNDFYGGHRPGDNLYAETLVAVRCADGERLWHFQVVHHGVWDYDLPAAPMLVDLTVDGRRVPAVVQLTKQGFVFVFDRRDGTPVWPIEERAVPQSDVPGERTSPTQPFPTRPPPFERQGVTEDDLIDFTPELRARALEAVRASGIAFAPLYQPPTLGGVFQLPGYGGGANWAGGAFDPSSGRLYVPSITGPTALALTEPDRSRSPFRYVRRFVDAPTLEGGLPVLEPPWGRITAYDLARGEIAWQVANGAGPRDHPLLASLDLPDLGSKGRAAALVTSTLLFVTEGSGRTTSSRGGGGPRLRAFDKETGAVLATLELPGETTGTPMTYLHEGRQYVVVAVGSSPPRLVALALPGV